MTIYYASSIAEIRQALDDPSITTISVAPGDYYVTDRDEYQGFVIDRDVEIVSSIPGELVNFHAREDFTKGIFYVESGASATFDGIGFYDTRDLYGTYQQMNEAAIRHEGDVLIVRNSYFSGNSNAILGSEVDLNDNKHLIVEDSMFNDNGNSSQEHHIYFIGNSVTVTGSSFTDSHSGHAIKTVVSDFTKVIDSFIDDAGSSANHAINVTGGGDLILLNNEIIKSASADNPYVIFYVPHRGHESGDIIIEGNEIHSDWDGSTGGTLLLGNYSSSEAVLSGNTLTGSFATNLIYGLATDSGSTINGEPLSDILWLSNTTELSGDADLYIDGNGFNPPLYSGSVVGPVNGGQGNDVLIGQDEDRDVDVLLGGAGNDYINGGDGVDFLYGEDGDDIIVTGTTSTSAPVDFASGGAGNDWIVAGAADSSNTTSAYLIGGEGNDFLDASRAYAAMLMGDGGDDVMLGAGYRDWLNGGTGDDYLYGGSNFDHLLGGEGTDTAIYLGAYGVDLTVEADYRVGDVRIIALHSETDEVGSAAYETAVSVEYIQFSNGVLNTLTFEFTPDEQRINLEEYLNRGVPTEETFAAHTVETYGDDGSINQSHYVENSLVAEVLTESNGDSQSTEFNENGAVESITYVDGSEARSWQTYTLIYDTETGELTGQEMTYDNGTTRSLSLTDAGEAPQAPETENSIVGAGWLHGAGGNDYIELTGSNVRAYGGAGDDHIALNNYATHAIAGDGDDLIVFANKAHSAYGGNGADSFVIDSGEFSVSIRDFDVSEDTLYFANGSGGLLSFADVQAAMIDSDAGVQIVTDNGTVTLDNVSADDLLAVNLGFYQEERENTVTLNTPDTETDIGGAGWLFGSEVNDRVTSGQGNIAMYGKGGDDHMIAENWNVRMLGGAGDDLLEGRATSAIMIGGAGQDTFYFTEHLDGQIVDFQTGVDILAIDTETFGYADFWEVMESLSDTANGAVLSNSETGDSLLFKGVSSDQLNEDDFLFL